ncbi:MAG TPA: 2-hydroxychromene-2-carboxylate isomerase [Rhodocyclaceae bacterium]|nr:2-hydroxychromene-2-carboxylate isomerase [Rhodocyclaceae bacterium]
MTASFAAPIAAPIDFYFDFISPFGYLAAMRIDDIAARHGRTTRWHPFLLGITVVKIMGLKPLLDTPLKGPYLMHDIPRLAKMLDVPIRLPAKDVMFDNLPATRAYYWLADQDPERAKAFAKRLYALRFQEIADLTRPELLAHEAQSLGFDGAKLQLAIETPEIKQRVKDAVDAAVARGVFGSPFIIADGEPFWGCDRLWMLDHWLTHRSFGPQAGGPLGPL